MTGIEKFIKKIEVGNNMHSVLMMRGGDVCFEGYWEPYTRDSLQRMYSQTKSLVGIAIGMLEYEGKLSIDDEVYKYFPDKLEKPLPEMLRKQTIRNNLMMCTSTECPDWFTNADKDRVHLYFNSPVITKAPGTLFEYDSAGTQVLGCLAERISGMSPLDYIRSKTGLFKNAKMLKVPTGESWCDSSLICPIGEIAEFGRFVMNGCIDGNGRETVSREFLKDAVSCLVSTDSTGFFSYKALGYGYQIWHTSEDGFAFFGMGNQLTICIPSKDFVFSCTADDQGYPEGRRVIMDALFEDIVPKLDEAFDRDYKPSLSLKHAEGNVNSPIAPAIDGVRYVAVGNKNTGFDPTDGSDGMNPMGIRWFTLDFMNDSLDFVFENATGVKKITAGACKNIIDLFPEEGYSRETGGMRAPGNKYRAAFSYAFRGANNLLIQCRIIDEYLGNLSVFFGFDGDYATVRFVKNAENFLNEYSGVMICKKE